MNDEGLSAQHTELLTDAFRSQIGCLEFGRLNLDETAVSRFYMQATPNVVGSQDDAREELAIDSGSHGFPEAFLHLPKACRRRI